jgi:hypothetical protein
MFDLLKGEETPTFIFGNTFIEPKEEMRNLQVVSNEAKRRFVEMFLGNKKEITISFLEKTIRKMWEEGWTPQKGNINLFATDFGAILTCLLLKRLNGKIVFRSKTDLNNLSIWWEKKKIEVFPFHKMLKRLSSQEGDDIEYFFNQIEQMVK